MSKQILVDYIPFRLSKEMIAESIKNNNGRLIVSGVLQRADSANQNNRVYPRPILEREVKKFIESKVKQNRALGELDHPDSSVVNLANVSHNILEVKWAGDDVVGKVEVLNTPAGNILKALFEAGVTLGISSRGMGSVKQISEDKVEVQEDFDLVAWDFVSDPSTHGAFLRPVNESLLKNIVHTNPYEKINKIITDIIISSQSK